MTTTDLKGASAAVAPALPKRGIARRRTLRGALASLALLPAAAARAAAWPTRPVRMIVPVAPGGSVDPLARLIGRQLSERLGQPFIVENHAGAGGNLAFELVAHAKPDGYTLLVGWDSLTINPALYARVDYDAVRDFTPVIQTVRTAQLLVVRADLPAATLPEFLALAAGRRLTLGSPGNGSIGHLTAELLRARAGLEWTHVPYRGGGPALQDLIAGHIDSVMLTLPAATEHVRAGRIRALAVSTRARAPALPDVPTIEESGITPFDVSSWQGLLFPAGTEAAIVEALNHETREILALPEVATQLARAGFEPEPGTPAALAARIEADLARWPEIVRASGARVD